MPGDPLSRPLIEIARELRDRRTSARELVEAAIARHERFGERLHAYSFWAYPVADAGLALPKAREAGQAGRHSARLARQTASTRAGSVLTKLAFSKLSRPSMRRCSLQNCCARRGPAFRWRPVGIVIVIRLRCRSRREAL